MRPMMCSQKLGIMSIDNGEFLPTVSGGREKDGKG